MTVHVAAMEPPSVTSPGVTSAPAAHGALGAALHRDRR